MQRSLFPSLAAALTFMKTTTTPQSSLLQIKKSQSFPTGQVSLISDHPCCSPPALFVKYGIKALCISEQQLRLTWIQALYRKTRESHFGIRSKRPLEDDKLKQTCRVPLTSEEFPHAVQTQELSYSFRQKKTTKPIFKHSSDLHTGIQKRIFTALLHNFSSGLRYTKGQIFTNADS